MGSTGQGTEEGVAVPAAADAFAPLSSPASLDRVDAMTRRAIETLLDTPEGWRRVARDLVAAWPSAPALELVFAIVSAAEAIEATFAPGSPGRAGAEAGFKVAALLGVDLFAMQSLGLPHHSAADLATYWQTDPWFRLL